MRLAGLSIGVIFLIAFLTFPAYGDDVSDEKTMTYPNVPRISAAEAFILYKEGKAILIQAGGQDFKKRHIAGAHDVNWQAVKNGQIALPAFPMSGIEILSFCY